MAAGLFPARGEAAPACRELGDNCRTNAECCVGVCDDTKHCVCPLGDSTCQPKCREIGSNCRSNAECCDPLICDTTGHCICPPTNTNCRPAQCRADGKNCRANADCCSRLCTNGTCTGCPSTSKVCGGQCVPCPPADQCKNNVCAPNNAALCIAQNKTNGTTCNDGKPCTVNDTCQNGVCQGTPKNCDDGNPCTTDACDPATGNCIHTPLSGTPCETGNRCTADTCQNGACIQGPESVTCLQCQKCDPANGTCQPISGGTCNDGNPCTVNDTCQNGVCRGTLRDCDDGNPCTVDTCDPANGQCQHTNVANGTPCPTGTCQDGRCQSDSGICPVVLQCGVNSPPLCGTGGPFGYCYCVPDFMGNTVCIEEDGCRATTCTTNADCAADRVCALSCCGLQCFKHCPNPNTSGTQTSTAVPEGQTTPAPDRRGTRGRPAAAGP